MYTLRLVNRELGETENISLGNSYTKIEKYSTQSNGKTKYESPVITDAFSAYINGMLSDIPEGDGRDKFYNMYSAFILKEDKEPIPIFSNIEAYIVTDSGTTLERIYKEPK